MTKAAVKRIIRARLEKAMECEFKQAWIPAGWAVIKVDVFVEELSETLAKELSTEKGKDNG